MNWTTGEVKEIGKRAFRINYWRCVLTAFLLTLITGGAAYGGGTWKFDGSKLVEEGKSLWESIRTYFEQNPASIYLIVGGSVLGIAIAVLLKIFLLNPLEVGCARFFRKNISHPAEFKAIGEGFGDYGHVFGTLLRRDLFVWLWSLLFVIPGIIKSYSYRMVPYIIKDEPDLSAKEVLQRSKELMRGHKWHTFILDLSFLGWIILAVLTLGVLSFFWVDPYIKSTDAALYSVLKGER
ncbi:MAG: DUF975 family protein [Lachnospiraceae bacterium]|jgi:uncharacterized membrane protein|nr:DUF975 family protein [Lachnospiraceae bacterium]